MLKKLQLGLAVIAAGIIAADLSVVAAGRLGLRWNHSISLPSGLYTTTAKSTLVEFCPAQPLGKLALARGYRDDGRCADGGAPLLKPIVAREGDTVSLTDAGIAVNGVLLSNTAPRPKDSRGRILDHYPFGVYTVGKGMVWVASSYNARSFDSRYLGPVDDATIMDFVRPVWTWQ